MPRRPGAALSAILLAWLLTAVLAAGELPANPKTEAGVVVLKNGEVLTGRVVRAGDFYTVSRDGGEIRLKIADVQQVCADLDEAYWQKRDALPHGQAEPRLDLADWCLHQGLSGYAARELSDALRLDAKHPRAPLLKRRLDLAVSQAQTPEYATGKEQSGPTNKELDRLVRGLPDRVMEQFTRGVQPLLLNHCTSSGCHGPRSETKLSLYRAPISKLPGRRLTQRNLHTLLQFIERDDPLTSPLLTIPIEPHGTQKTPIFTDRDSEKFQELVLWVQLISGEKPPQPEPAATSVNRLQAMLNAAHGADQQADPDAIRANYEEDVEPPVRARKRSLSSGEEEGERAAPDPFDPGEFNRRYAPPVEPQTEDDEAEPDEEFEPDNESPLDSP